MELSRLTERVREELNESGHGTFFTDADILDSLEDGYTLFCLFTGFLRGEVEVPFVGDQVYYDLSVYQDFARPISVFNKNTDTYIQPISVNILHKNILSWEITSGVPQFFCCFPTQMIAFYPHYSATPAKGFTLQYVKWPYNFRSNSEIELPNFAENCLIFYSVSDLYDQLLETTKSAIAWKRFTEDLDMCKFKIARLNKTDYIDTMRSFHVY